MTASFGDALADKRDGNNGQSAPVSALAGLSPSPGSYPAETVIWLVLGSEAASGAHKLGLPFVAVPSTSWAYAPESWVRKFAGRSVVITPDCDAIARAA